MKAFIKRILGVDVLYTRYAPKDAKPLNVSRKSNGKNVNNEKEVK